MKKGLVIGIVLVVVLVLVAGFYSVKTPETKVLPPQNVVPSNYNLDGPQINSNLANIVFIKDFAFSPAEVTINVGDSVTWKNEDEVDHTLVSNSGSEIDSGALPNSAMYLHTFMVAGTYEYHCGIHSSMEGKVIVQ